MMKDMRNGVRVAILYCYAGRYFAVTAAASIFYISAYEMS